jgi:hypothetical protein
MWVRKIRPGILTPKVQGTAREAFGFFEATWALRRLVTRERRRPPREKPAIGGAIY